MHFLSEYALYFAKIATLVIAILAVVAGVMVLAARAKEKAKEKGKLIITKLNKKYDEMAEVIRHKILNKHELKKFKKEQKAKLKQQAKTENSKPRLFVINFHGDIRASAINSLREEITAILLTITPHDEVLIRLESGGGLVNAYGLAASQLQRLKEASVKFTVAVDKVAASGGYMMACVADKLIAAPFAVIGSIGVVAQLPNFHRLLDKHHVDFEQITAGQYKRTLTLFGKNTKEGREKVQQEIEDFHELFKNFIKDHRPNVELEKVATGEHWFATRTLDLKLIDKLQTSDDYLLNNKDNFDIYEIIYKIKKPFGQRLSFGISSLLAKLSRGSFHSSGEDYI